MMDDDEYEGTAGSDVDDLLDIECDMDDDEGMGLDVSLLMSDDDEIVETLINLEDTPIEVDKPDSKVIVSEKPLIVPKSEDKKKSEIKVDDKKKSEANVNDKKTPEAKVEEKVEVNKKPEAQKDDKKIQVVKDDDKKNTDVKADDKQKLESKANADNKQGDKLKADDKQKPEPNRKPEPKVEDKNALKAEVDNKKTPEPKEDDKKKSEPKEDDKKKSEPKVNDKKKPELKVDDEQKSEPNSDDKKKTETKTPEKKNDVTQKSDPKKETAKKTSVTETIKIESKEAVVISDEENVSDVGSVDTIEADVDDFPEEWMVIDEMEEDEPSKSRTDKSKRNDTSKTIGSHRSESSRNRSRHKSRSRSRSRNRTRDERDGRRSRTSEKDRSSQKDKEGKDIKASKHKTPEKDRSKELEKKTDVKKSDSASKSEDSKTKKKDDSKANTNKETREAVKTPVPAKPVDPFKNMRDTIEKFDKNWRWNLKISPIEINDLKSESLRQIIALANDSVMVFNMQNDKKRKYGFLDLCVSSAGDIRTAIDKLCQLKLESNFIHVSISHKLFEENSGTESALLKLDMKEGKCITSQPTKGTEKQRQINISNGPKGMSKIMLDAVFSKIAKIEISENTQNDTSSATVLCANPESVGAVLRFYQSVVIGGRRLQLRSEVTPPPKPKDSPKEERRSPAITNKSQNNQSNKKSNQNDRNSRQNDNRRRSGNNDKRRSASRSNDGLLGPIPGAADAAFSTAMGSGRGFENVDLEQRHRAILAREEAERRHESMKRLGLNIGVESFMERPSLLTAHEMLAQETERMQMELSQQQRAADIFDNNYRADLLRQEEMQRLQRDIELKQQAELLERQERQRQQDELLLRLQQEQQLKEQRMEQERLEREKQERLELERKERERLERERLERERERLERERERLERERLEKERQEKEHKERQQRQERERLERERKEREHQEELKRQEEMRRKERDSKMRQEQQRDSRFQDMNRRQDMVRQSNNQWQHNLHLQNEQEQFEKEIGMGNRQDFGRSKSNLFEYERPVVEEKKNLHQKIREQWERQVAEASNKGNSVSSNTQHDMRRNDSNISSWNRGDNTGNGNSGYGAEWNSPSHTAGSQSGFGNNWSSQKAPGLLGAAPDQPNMSPYTSAVREYDHQPVKRSNPWGEETPNYGEKRLRDHEDRYGSVPRDSPNFNYRQGSQDQWRQANTREPERNLNQSWGADPYDRHRQGQQQYNTNW
ncbi:inner centromere protein isoform X2 [Patella vulgata]|uniref:inner centromere protein isoform X2 n=1 Tax=Patella vulgata TaxID=6465 RepID=UPI0024A964CF|nr:inner centromere protein isoform X2 [Patella vulgata]